MKILETNRLMLRTWSPDDAEAVLRIFGDPETSHFTGAEPLPDLERARRWITFSLEYQKEHGFCEWAVVEKASGKVLGACGLGYFDGRPEIGLGYHFIREYWGSGYASEAARACVEYAFNRLNVPEIAALTDPQNIASRRVLEKAGLKYVGLERAEDETEARLYVVRKAGSKG